MKIGIKRGPDNWRQAIEETSARYLEVWFRLDWKDRYEELFFYCQKKNIQFGLHFWAITKEGYEPNIAFGGALAEESSRLIKKTIDIAHHTGASYVNIHPGSLTRKKLDLDNHQMVVQDERISEEDAEPSLRMHAHDLSSYASHRNVLFLIETLPKNELAHWRDGSGRTHVQDSQNISPEMIGRIANSGIFVTNDFGHTVSSWTGLAREQLMNRLTDTTKRLASQTKLIHLNTVRPPFNGTDSHNGMLAKDFAQDVLPTRKQIISLLKIFKDRDDVWIIPEPQVEDMEGNYWEIQKIVNEL